MRKEDAEAVKKASLAAVMIVGELAEEFRKRELGNSGLWEGIKRGRE